MQNNIGATDKMIRLSVAILVGILYYTEIISGTVALVLGIFSLLLFLTSFISFCPLYMLLGVNTCKNRSAK